MYAELQLFKLDEKGLINSYLNVNAAMLTWHVVIGAQETLSTECIYDALPIKMAKSFKTI